MDMRASAASITALPSRPARSAPGLLARWWRRCEAARARRQSIAALAALDDRMLRDLGLHRSELASCCSEAEGAAPATRRRLRSPPALLLALRHAWR